MAELKEKTGTNFDEAKYDDENFMKKLKILAEKVGISVEEAKERKLSKNQLKKMIRNEVSLCYRSHRIIIVLNQTAIKLKCVSLSKWFSHFKRSKRKGVK